MANNWPYDVSGLLHVPKSELDYPTNRIIVGSEFGTFFLFDLRSKNSFQLMLATFVAASVLLAFVCPRKLAAQDSSTPVIDYSNLPKVATDLWIRHPLAGGPATIENQHYSSAANSVVLRPSPDGSVSWEPGGPILVPAVMIKVPAGYSFQPKSFTMCYVTDDNDDQNNRRNFRSVVEDPDSEFFVNIDSNTQFSRTLANAYVGDHYSTVIQKKSLPQPEIFGHVQVRMINPGEPTNFAIAAGILRNIDISNCPPIEATNGSTKMFLSPSLRAMNNNYAIMVVPLVHGVLGQGDDFSVSYIGPFQGVNDGDDDTLAVSVFGTLKPLDSTVKSPELVFWLSDDGETFHLSWIDPSGSFALQQSTDFHGEWIPVGASIERQGDKSTVKIDCRSSSNKIFRLRSEKHHP